MHWNLLFTLLGTCTLVTCPLTAFGASITPNLLSQFSHHTPFLSPFPQVYHLSPQSLQHNTSVNYQHFFYIFNLHFIPHQVNKLTNNLPSYLLALKTILSKCSAKFLSFLPTTFLIDLPTFFLLQKLLLASMPFSFKHAIQNMNLHPWSGHI